MQDNFILHEKILKSFILANIQWKISTGNQYLNKIVFTFFNPQAPVAQKIADEVIFRRSQGEGVEFLKVGPH